MENRCFMCEEVTDTTCQDCGVSVCSEEHLSYHLPSNTIGSLCSRQDYAPKLDQTANHCQPFRIESGAKGRYFIATRDIKPLELILTDSPVLRIPAVLSEPICFECLKQFEWNSERQCPECGLPMCSPECISGPYHREECEYLQSKGVRFDNNVDRKFLNAALLPIRSHFLKKKGGVSWYRFNHLQSNTFNSDCSKGFWTEVYRYVQDQFRFNEVTFEDLEYYSGLKITNGVSLEVIGLSGAGMYGAYALINHSCVCNSRYTINKDSLVMEVRAQTLIKKGEEITTRYILPTTPAPTRKLQFEKHWQFTCTCFRCLDPTELGTNLSAIYCLKCKSGLMRQRESLEEKPSETWFCNECGIEMPESKIDSFLSLIQISPQNNKGDPEKTLTIISRLLHKNHGIILNTKMKLIEKLRADFESSINDLEKVHGLAVDILDTLSIIDPGYTPRRGELLQICLESLVKKAKEEFKLKMISRNEMNERLSQALAMTKEIKLCLMYCN